MAKGFTYEIRLKDQMSKGFHKAAANAAKFHNKTTQNLKSFQANLKRVPLSINRLKTGLSSFKLRAKKAFSPLSIRKFTSGIGKAIRRMRQMRNLPPRSMNNRIKSLTRSMGALIGITAGIGAITGFVKLGADLEQTRISYQTMLQSAEKGNALLLKINEFANVTPFSNKDLQEASKMLLNFGIKGNRVIPILKTIGDVSGGNKEKLKGLTLAFSQVSSAGKLQGQDLLQMINAGFNPLLEISRKTGKSMASLRDQMSKGRISAKMVEGAFQSVTAKGGMFYQMMEKQSQTLAGKWSTLMGTIQSKLAGSSERMSSFFGKAVDFFLGIIKHAAPISKAWANLKEGLVMIWEAISSFVGAMEIFQSGASGAKGAAEGLAKIISMAAKVIKIFATGLGTLLGWLKPLAPILKLAGALWLILNIIMAANPVIAIVMGIILLVGWIVTLVKRTEGWGKSFKALGDILKTVALMAWEQMKYSFKMIGFAIQKLWLKFKQFGQYLKGLFMNVGKAIKLALSFDFSGAKKALTAPIQTAAKAEIEALEKKREALKTTHKLTQMGYIKDLVKASSNLSIKFKKEEVDKKSTAGNGSGLGLNTTSPNAKDISSTVASTTEGIASGGKRSLVFNIQIDKVIDNITQNISEGQEQAEDLVDTILEGLTRRIGGTIRSASV